MGKPISTIGHNHVCPRVDPGPKPHVGGPVITGQNFVRINGIPVTTVGDKTLCTGMPGPDPITSGSGIAKINGKPIARIGDSTSHGGKIVQGWPNIRAD